MRPFDLAAAIRGEPIQHEYGGPVKFLMYAPEALYPVVIMMDDGRIITLNPDGTDSTGPFVFMAPKKRTVYVNFYNDDSCMYFDTLKDANENCKRWDTWAAAVPVEIEK